ncbi:hypothetical protein Daus18300_002994 [Diaporthe australafricana]|uniref:2EXR domain-containing protein n=1 Tax=Diaporthe australafricana TaxID=127596 RepID=A0ABR3XJK0_9PEZI
MTDLFRYSMITQGDFDWAMGLADTNGRMSDEEMKAAQDETTRKLHQLSKPNGGHIMDRDETGDNGRVFHFFPKLPAELQLQVWKEAAFALKVPKMLEFEFDLAYDPHADAALSSSGNGLIACFRPIRYERELDSHMGMIKACYDSRKAFLDHGGYTMLKLTYVVDPVKEEKREKREQVAEEASKKALVVQQKPTIPAAQKKRKIEKRTAKEKKAAEQHKKACALVKKALEAGMQMPPLNAPTVKGTKIFKQTKVLKETKIFKRVLFPVKFDSCFVIHKIANRFSYKGVHPSPPAYENVFAGATGLDFVHSIKKLAFSIHGDEWKPSTLFCDLYATATANRYVPSTAPNYTPLTLGALEELSYISAKAVERRCCMGELKFWNEMATIKIQDFQATPQWSDDELYRLHRSVLGAWERKNRVFGIQRGQRAYTTRQICTCKYNHL